MKFFFKFLLILFSFWGNEYLIGEEKSWANRLKEYPQIDFILVKKSLRLMEIYSHHKLIRSFNVALGRNPVRHKKVEGDCKTPEGQYQIVAKNLSSKVYKAMLISYPNSKDRKKAQKLKKSPGGNICVHGLRKEIAPWGEYHFLRDHTRGCIAVSNSIMDFLYEYVSIGTPIQILP